MTHKNGLRFCRPYVRLLGGSPLVVLTTPAKFALCVLPDGTLVHRTLCGVSGHLGYADDVPGRLTWEQRDVIEEVPRERRRRA